MAINFDSVAPWYERLARLAFGNQLRQARWAFLPALKEVKYLMIIGGGTGEIWEGWPQAHALEEVWYVEPSAVMVEQAKRRWNHRFPNTSIKVHWIEQPIEAFVLNRQVEAIITCFFWDLFPEKQQGRIFRQLDELLDEKGKWLYADFVSERGWHHLFLGIMYRFFRITAAIPARKLHNPTSLWTDAHFQMVRTARFYAGFIETILWEKTSSTHP